MAANTSAHSPGMYEADVAIIVPPSHDPSYVEVIEQLCLKHDIGMLCSFHELDVFVLAQHRKRLIDVGVIPVLPDFDWAKICLDKYECGLRLQECGWQVPWTATTLAATELALAEGRVRFPLVIKARRGFGSLGFHRCRDLNELRTLHRQAQIEIAGSLLQSFSRPADDELVVIQEMLVGAECCVDLVNDLKGNYAAHFACEVHTMRTGESDCVTTIDPAFLGDLPVRFSQMTRHSGLWGMDLMMDRGIPKIIDINPRFTGDYAFQHLAGANIPAALLAWARDEKPAASWLRPEIGMRCYKDLAPMPARSRAIE